MCFMGLIEGRNMLEMTVMGGTLCGVGRISCPCVSFCVFAFAFGLFLLFVLFCFVHHLGAPDVGASRSIKKKLGGQVGPNWTFDFRLLGFLIYLVVIP